MWFLNLYFLVPTWVSEAAWFWWAVKTDDWVSMIIHVLRGVAWTGLHVGAMRLRAAVAGLPPADLQKFLIDTIFKGAAGTMVSVLFVSFRTTKCVFEENFVSCSNTASSAGYVCLFLLMWWFQKIVQASIKYEWRQHLALTVEKLAHLEIGWRRQAQAALMTLTGLSGLLLFSTMDAKSSDYRLIRAVGLVGCFCGFFSISIEIFSTHKFKENSQISNRTRSGAMSSGSEDDKKVEECSAAYIVVCFLLTLLNVILWTCYAITLESHWWMVANSIWAVVVTSYILSIFMKPKREDTLFEAISCLASEGFDSRLCENSASATKFLSLNLICLTLKSLLNKATPKFVQRAMILSYEDLARVNLKFLQKIQGTLFAVTAMCSLFLFSVVGVEAEPNEGVYLAGQVGAICIGVAVLIDVKLMLGVLKGAGTTEVEGQAEQEHSEVDPAKRFSASHISDGLALGAVV
ncbi:hypothetical protein TrVE_jg8491 [Triparma verrucosa]|nr:hypothetical protein TrVE_jg8491 [Triparma verrucosa]